MRKEIVIVNRVDANTMKVSVECLQAGQLVGYIDYDVVYLQGIRTVLRWMVQMLCQPETFFNVLRHFDARPSRSRREGSEVIRTICLVMPTRNDGDITLIGTGRGANAEEAKQNALFNLLEKIHVCH